MSSLVEYLKKWWLPVATFLLATTPPALVLFFQNILLPHIEALELSTLLNIATLLLWLVLLLFAFILLQHPWLKWDEPTGTWINSFNGLRYCGTCHARQIIVPLKNEITGWRCVACDTFRTDPARKQKDQPKPNLGKDAWMAQ